MPNEVVVVDSFIRGSVTDNPLTDSATTFNAAILASVRAIGSSGTMRVIFDPLNANGRLEIAHMTAHTASATVATIARGKDGTAAVEHPSGELFVCAWIAKDFPPSIHRPWGGNLGLDEEFDREYATTFPTAPHTWAWVNQNSSTFEEKWGRGGIKITPSSSTQVVGIVHPLSGYPSTWELTAAFSWQGEPGGNTGYGGSIFLSDGTKLLVFNNKPAGNYETAKWNSPTSAAGSNFGVTGANNLSKEYILRVRKNSATSYDFECSRAGEPFFVVSAATNITSHLTPTHIGFGGGSFNNLQCNIACHWWRVR